MEIIFQILGVKYSKKFAAVIMNERNAMAKEGCLIDDRYKENCIEILTENLAPLRAKAGMTQEEIANIIGVSRQTYYSIETRKRSMSWLIYLSLILLYDTNVNTHSMIRDLNAYPTELMITMTGNVK